MWLDLPHIKALINLTVHEMYCYIFLRQFKCQQLDLLLEFSNCFIYLKVRSAIKKMLQRKPLFFFNELND